MNAQWRNTQLLSLCVRHNSKVREEERRRVGRSARSVGRRGEERRDEDRKE
jgi:hypothetical protein